MNIMALLCREIMQNPNIDQGELALRLNLSSSQIRKAIKNAMVKSYIREIYDQYRITGPGKE